MQHRVKLRGIKDSSDENCYYILIVIIFDSLIYIN